jgi:thiamine-monophosphate kinase
MLDAIRRAIGPGGGRRDVEVGIGDDAAVLAAPSGARLVATVDMLAEGQHFRRSGPGASDLRDIGWRALAVNLSDIAAMGASPLWALSSLGLPTDMGPAEVERLSGGMAGAATEYGVAVVGGNLARTGRRLVVDVMLLGQVDRPILRGGAQAGDAVCVTGRLGAAAAGLALARASERVRAGLGVDAEPLFEAQRRPRPRLREAAALSGLPPGAVHAMCDVSDGLASDLSHLCGPSTGAVLWRDALPVPPSVTAAARLLGRSERTALNWALHGGEDYELLCAIASDAVPDARRALAAAGGVDLHAIGRFVARSASDPAVRVTDSPSGARLRPVPVRGWDPFRTGGRSR